MKKIIFISVALIFLVSCTTIRHIGRGYVNVYAQHVGDVGGPVYLILREPSYYEFYSPSSGSSVFGDFKVSNDTLCLYSPKYDYEHGNNSLKKVDTTEISFNTIPTYFLIGREELIDITEYGKYPELAPLATKGGVFDGFVRVTYYKPR
jgi:hypothetical protein